jgi:hypothetical protein
MLNKKEKKKGGLYEQLKNSKSEPIKYTKEYLVEVFKDVFNRPVDNDKKVNLPLEWRHYEWEENGEQFSCWKLMVGGIFCQLTTGDGGKAEFDKILKEEFSKLPVLSKILSKKN